MGSVTKFAVKPIAVRDEEPESDPVEDFETILAELPSMWSEPMSADSPTTDKPYWVILSFQLREQKLEFLAALGLSVEDDVHQDGAAFERALDGVRAKPKATVAKFDVAPVGPHRAARRKGALHERADRESIRREQATQTAFWVAFCYATGAIRERVAGRLRAMGAREDAFRFCGNDVARAMGIDIKTPSPTWKTAPVRGRWMKHV